MMSRREDQEFHVTAYAVRGEKLNSEDLKKKHEELTIVCDEDGFYKQLPINKSGSIISGIELRGDIVCFLSHYNHETEEETYPVLDVKTMAMMLNSITK